MIYSRAFFVWMLTFSGLLVGAQSAEVVNVGGPKYLVKSSTLPEDITSSRSVVVVHVPDEEKMGFTTRGDWKTLAEEVHRSLRKIGVDAVWYLYDNDLNAGPEVNEAYHRIFEKRGIRNLVYIRKIGNLADPGFNMKVIPLNDQGEILHGQLTWMEHSESLGTLFLRLGRQVLRQQLERTNFLIPEKPEYLEDLAVFAGNRLENFPSRLQSLPLAVAAFQKLPTANVTNQELLEEIEAYNKSVDQQNQELKEVLSLYPFKYELVEDVDNESLYKKGFQYVLFPLSSTGKTVKKILNYPTNKTETAHLATVFNESGKQELIQVPVDANICKFYIKQTIVKDIHTGDTWDAEPSWQDSLRNFILHLRTAFRLPLGG